MPLDVAEKSGMCVRRMAARGPACGLPGCLSQGFHVVDAPEPTAGSPGCREAVDAGPGLHPGMGAHPAALMPGVGPVALRASAVLWQLMDWFEASLA